MKNRLVIFAAILIVCTMSLFNSGCGNDHKDSATGGRDGKVVAKINDYRLTLSEFNSLMKFESGVDPEFQVTMKSREKFLDYLIQKELYIQEASKLKLDRKESFIQSIERYWESTLIRHLLELKEKEFLKQIVVPKEAIERYYNNNKAAFEGVPLSEVKEQIIQRITELHLREMNASWTASLRKSADIEIDESVFREQPLTVK